MKKFLILSLLISLLCALEVTDEGRVIHFDSTDDFKPYFTKLYNFSKENSVVRISKKLIKAPDDNTESLLIAEKTVVVPANSYLNLIFELRPLNPGEYEYQIVFNEKDSKENFLLPVRFIKN
jgi:hypothetical protein